MIGLVNAAGTPETARVQSASAAKLPEQEQQSGNLVPILSNERAAERVLRTAVETIDFATGEAQRALPGGEQSDRTDQADLEAKTAGGVGSMLDVTA